MLSRPRKPPPNRLLPSGSSRLSHQVKFSSSLWKTRRRKSTSVAAVDVEDPDRRQGVDRRVDVVEAPLVGGQCAVRMLEPLPEQDQQLVLGEGRVQVGPGDGVEREIPCREPGILPRIRHRQHVERVQVPPTGVAAGAVAGRRRGLPGVTVEPPVHLIGVDLLAPDQAGAGLAQDPHLLGAEIVGGVRREELVGLPLAGLHDLVEGPGRTTTPLLRSDRRFRSVQLAIAARLDRRRGP